jgi:tellurium resistance protein TerD
MAAAMKRGTNVSLSREIPGLTGLVVGAKWDAGAETALAENLVTAAILCGPDGKALSDEHFVFFNQLASPDLSVQEMDAAVGPDAEQIEIDLPKVPAAVDRIVVALYINDGPGRRRALGQLRSCVVRVLNAAGNQELVTSEDLAPGLTTETAVVLGEVYRHNGEWKFRVLGQGYAQGLAGIAADYGLSL